MITIRIKLYTEPQDNLSATQQILLNRGIPVEEQEKWEKANLYHVIADPEAFNAQDTLRSIAKDVFNASFLERKIVVIVDCDTDGFSAAALFINFLYRLYPTYTKEKVSFILHEGKQHGLNDLIDQLIEMKPYLVISPDGGTNDIECHKRLAENGIKCAVLDHHECEINLTDSPANILNNQTSDYPNKQLSGVGIVWQFCRHYEQYQMHFLQGKTTNRLLDLCALGNCGDMMDYRELEVRAIMLLGLEHINNAFLQTIIAAHDYSIQKMNGLNYYSCAFYVVPYINAICRTGTMEEKELVFRSLLDMYEDEMVPCSKRGHKGEIWPLVEEAVLVCERVKRRQTDVQNKAMAILENQIEEEHLTDNAIIVCECEADDIDANVVGLVANKIQAKYQHPTMVLRRLGDTLSGSARNTANCELSDMKGLCQDTGLMTLAAGHSKAFGCAFKTKNKEKFLEVTNKAYEGIQLAALYNVDYIWKQDDDFADKVLEIGRLNIYGQNIQESLVAVENIVLNPHMLTLMGKNKDTIKITFPNGVCAIMFKQSEELYKEMCGMTEIDIVAKCSINEWNGTITPQLLVEDFDLREHYEF